ncbi:sigma-70 family RNA polymerase sigma factor [Streptomyces sp. NPDC002073]
MSVDERDESLGGAAAETDAGTGAVTGAGAIGLPARQVPAQRESGSGATTAELPPSDGDLIARMRAGDDGAYEELFRRHADAVRRYARTCCRDAHTADDLTAEVFARTLQAVRGGAGPDQAVRAYLLTTVRRVAAAWTKTAKREQLVEDFAVFAEQAARGAEAGAAAAADSVERGADVRAMEGAEQTLAMRAFRSLPERWQAVLWHTTVEDSSPSAIAPLFGLSPNATAVLASRAREGLKQAYLQAHVSAALSQGGDCAQHADRLGAYARGGLRMRAERGLRKHLEECAKCRLAAGELKDVNAGIPALLPVAVIGWFAAGYAVKAAGVVAGGAVAAGGAGAAAAATGAGGAAGASAGGAAGAGAAAGGAGAGGSGAGAAAASEGIGLPAKAAVAAGLAVATAAGIVFAFVGDDQPQPVAKPKPSLAAPVLPAEPEPPAPTPPPVRRSAPAAPAAPPETEAPRAPKPSLTPRRTAAAPRPSPRPSSPRPARPAPSRPPVVVSPPSPKPPKPTPTPSPPRAPRSYPLSSLAYSVFGDHTRPELRTGRTGWVWQRWGLVIGGRGHEQGLTVRPGSSVAIALNRPCRVFSARVGVDDMSLGARGALRFAVYADGVRLWRSPALASGDQAVPVSVGIADRANLRLVVERDGPHGHLLLADWADSTITCP